MKVFIYTCILFYQSNNFLCVMCKERTLFQTQLIYVMSFHTICKKKTTFTGIIKFSMLIINASASNINVCHVYAGYKIGYLLIHVDGK